MRETPSTELDAVNVILTNMGEAPIDTLDEDDLPLDAEKAWSILAEVSEAVQIKGWFWNTETTTYAVDSDGTIKLPLERPTGVWLFGDVHHPRRLPVRDQGERQRAYL